jgi:transcription elongation GreA/GreB family factor
LLDEINQKIENKEYKTARDGKNEKHQVETDIRDLEADILESRLLMQTADSDIGLIEQYRKRPIEN